MERFADARPVRPIDSGAAADPLRLAVAAYLARYAGSSRDHAYSDLRCFLTWCAERCLDPMAASRVHLELYIRWMQEVRRFKPSTVSRRFSVTAGFYRIAVIDGVLEHSPAEHVRRPAVPPESPTLGFTHLQFEAMLTAARESPYRCDFALVAMLGLIGLRIFEATRADIADLGEEHGHRVLRVCGKSAKVVLVPLPPAAGRAIDRAVDGRSAGPILLNSRQARMDGQAPPGACVTWRVQRACGWAGRTLICCGHTFVTTIVGRGGWTCGTCRSPPGTPIGGRLCGTTGHATTSIVTPTTSWPPTWPSVPSRQSALRTPPDCL
jgi:integrase/recombinase XerD